MVFTAPELATQVAHGPAVQYWVVNDRAPALLGPLDQDGTWWMIAFGVDAEHGAAHGGVRAQRLLPHVVCVDLVSYRAPGAVAPDQVIREYSSSLPGLLGDLGAHRCAVLGELIEPCPPDERAAGQLVDNLAEQFLEHELRCLLAELREPVPLRHEAEHPVEPGQLVPDERGAEHDRLRPLDG